MQPEEFVRRATEETSGPVHSNVGRGQTARVLQKLIPLRRVTVWLHLALALVGSPLIAATWLILPVVICLSQRLSHACLSINSLYCETANGSLNQLEFI